MLSVATWTKECDIVLRILTLQTFPAMSDCLLASTTATVGCLAGLLRLPCASSHFASN